MVHAHTHTPMPGHTTGGQPQDSHCVSVVLMGVAGCSRQLISDSPLVCWLVPNALTSSTRTVLS